MMRKTSAEKGFSLVEMMIALFILSVSILALSGSTVLLIQNNLANETRDTAVRLSSEVANDLFALSFDDLATGARVYNVPFKGGTQSFNVAWTVTPKAGVKQVEINVTYTLRGTNYTNSTVVFRPDS